MPYYSNYAKEDDNQNGAAGQGQASESGVFQRGSSGSDQATGAPSTSGNSSGNPGAEPGAAQKNAANTGSQYQSLDTYLGGNADSNFGNKITSKVSDQQAKGYADQGAASNQFQNQVQSSNQVPTGDQISSAVANPTSADASQYQKWINQSYQGPKSLSDSGTVSGNYWNSTKKAVDQTGQLAGNDSGQYSLLNSYFGGPAGSSSYSSNNGPTGQQGLDLSLAQHTAGYGDNVGYLKQGASALQRTGLQGAQNLQNSASAQAGNVQQSANAARSAVGVDANGQIIQGSGAGAIGKLEGAINQGVLDANSSSPKAVTALQQQLTNGDISKLTPEQLQQFGLTAGDNTYGANLGQYVSAAPQYTAANTMTQDQLAQLQALQGLAGISPDTLASTTLTPGSAYNVDKSGAQGAINTAHNTQNKTAYEGELKNTPISLPSVALGGGGLFGTGIGGGRQTQASNSASIGEVLNLVSAIHAGNDYLQKAFASDPSIAQTMKKLGIPDSDARSADYGMLQNFANAVQPTLESSVANLKKKYNQT